MIRDDIKAATITAMKAGEKDRTAALRQISAKIKDRDIEERTSGKDIPDDELVTSVLQKMAKQRRESIEMYESGGRQELADKEKNELAVIEEFLPQMMSEEETKAAIEAIRVSAKSKSACLRRVRTTSPVSATIPAGDSCRKGLSSLELERLTHQSQGRGLGFAKGQATRSEGLGPNGANRSQSKVGCRCERR